MMAASATRSLPGWWRTGRTAAPCCRRRGRALDAAAMPVRRARRRVEHVVADAGEHQPAEAVGLRDGEAQQGHRAEREPTASTGSSGSASSTRAEVGVGLGLVRLRCGAVAEQVDADHVAPGVVEQLREPAALPGGRERATPAVHEYHRCGAAGIEQSRQLRTLPTVAVSLWRPIGHGAAAVRHVAGAIAGEHRPCGSCTTAPYDLTYSDVFMVPSLSDVGSRSRRRPHHPRRARHHHPGGRVEHDRRRRPAHGRDRGPPRRHHRAAPGHPARRHRDGHRLREDPPPGVRHAHHAQRRTTPWATRSGLIHKRAHGAVVVVDETAGRWASSPSTTRPASTASPSCRT